jgi:hypothetical protein
VSDGSRSFHKYRSKPFEEIEGDPALDYERNKPASAWAKLSHYIGRDADRSIRSRF